MTGEGKIKKDINQAKRDSDKGKLPGEHYLFIFTIGINVFISSNNKISDIFLQAHTNNAIYQLQKWTFINGAIRFLVRGGYACKVFGQIEQNEPLIFLIHC